MGGQTDCQQICRMLAHCFSQHLKSDTDAACFVRLLEFHFSGNCAYVVGIVSAAELSRAEQSRAQRSALGAGNLCVTHTPTWLIKVRVLESVIENLAITFCQRCARPQNLINGPQTKVIDSRPPFVWAISLENVLDINGVAKWGVGGRADGWLALGIPWHQAPPLNWSLGVKWHAALTGSGRCGQTHRLKLAQMFWLNLSRLPKQVLHPPNHPPARPPICACPSRRVALVSL